MNATIESPEARRARYLHMREDLGMKNAQIAREDGVTRQWVGEVLGTTPRGELHPRTRRNLLMVYRYIERRNSEFDSPTIGEIAVRFGTEGKPRSTSVVRFWLARMEELEMIAPRTPGRSRNLRVLKLNKRDAQIKMMLEEEE